MTIEDRPIVVCLCGSTRFSHAFREANLRETLAGRIVLTIGCDKAGLDELHKHKIEMADEILVLNVAGYIGDSTRSEIAHALAHGKPIRWLENVQ